MEYRSVGKAWRSLQGSGPVEVGISAAYTACWGQILHVATEFLRRFFLQRAPQRFVRMGHFGVLANRFRGSRPALCRQLASSSCAAPLRGAAISGIALDSEL